MGLGKRSKPTGRRGTRNAWKCRTARKLMPGNACAVRGALCQETDESRVYMRACPVWRGAAEWHHPTQLPASVPYRRFQQGGELQSRAGEGQDPTHNMQRSWEVARKVTPRYNCPISVLEATSPCTTPGAVHEGSSVPTSCWHPICLRSSHLVLFWLLSFP